MISRRELKFKIILLKVRNGLEKTELNQKVLSSYEYIYNLYRNPNLRNGKDQNFSRTKLWCKLLIFYILKATA